MCHLHHIYLFIYIFIYLFIFYLTHNEMVN